MGRLKISKKSKSTIIGIICGIGCAVCVGLYLSDVNEKANAAQAEMLAKYGGDQVEVCVAKRDIDPGETISESDIETRTWIASLLPSNAVSSRKDAVGKQVGSSILSGEVISSNRFGAGSADIEVPQGFSAISVPTKDIQSVGGALKAGMRADVYATGSSSTSKLGSNILILATNNTGEDSASDLSWVTIAVKPESVEEMVAASQNLDLYFVLPSQKSYEHKDSSGADTDEDVDAETM